MGNCDCYYCSVAGFKSWSNRPTLSTNLLTMENRRDRCPSTSASLSVLPYSIHSRYASSSAANRKSKNINLSYRPERHLQLPMHAEDTRHSWTFYPAHYLFDLLPLEICYKSIRRLATTNRNSSVFQSCHIHLNKPANIHQHWSIALIAHAQCM